MNRTQITDTSFAPRPEYLQVVSPTAGFMHPDEVLSEAGLTHSEKREILASWASDIRAVPNAPALRQLDNGAVLRLDDILRALSTLDDAWGRTQPGRDPRQGRRARFSKRLELAFRRPWRDDDDDDPPPCPAVISRPPGGPLWGGVTASPAMALAA
jgi:hypothetical protein